MKYRTANPEATWGSYSSSEWEQLILRCVSSEGPSLGLPGRRGSVVTAVAKVTSVFPGPSEVKVVSVRGESQRLWVINRLHVPGDRQCEIVMDNKLMCRGCSSSLPAGTSTSCRPLSCSTLQMYWSMRVSPWSITRMLAAYVGARSSSCSPSFPPPPPPPLLLQDTRTSSGTMSLATHSRERRPFKSAPVAG